MTVSRHVIDDFLAQRSLALVGVRRNGRDGFGNSIRREMAAKGWALHVVHPEVDRVGDAPCAHTLAEVASAVGGVVLVTPPEETAKLVDEAAAAGIRRVWMQQGAESPEALARCAAHGIDAVYGECILMFAEPTSWFHRAHRWLRDVAGELPEGDHLTLSALERKLLGEVSALGLPMVTGDPPAVTDDELAALPATAQRYLRFMGVVGRPRERSFLMRMEGRFLFGGTWVPCECAQYNALEPVARIFHMRLRVKGIVPTYVRDTYLRGEGHMLGRVLDAVPVVDDASEEVTLGECVTWLNDAVLMAPSMLLTPAVSWGDAGDGAFDLTLTDAGRTVRARVFVDASGAVTDFSTTDRFYAQPGSKTPPARAAWRTPVAGWQLHEGKRLPTAGRAVWMLPEGPLPYADFTFDPRAFFANAPPTR